MSEIHQYKLRNGSSPAWYDEGTGPTPDAWHLDCVQPDHIWRTVYQQGHEAASTQPVAAGAWSANAGSVWDHTGKWIADCNREHGLSVYGYAADLKAGVYHEGGSLMDYDADDILALRKWEDKGGMSEPEQP